MDFVVENLSCSHIVMLGKLGLEDLGALILMEHLCMKFRMPTRVEVAQCNQKIAISGLQEDW